MKTSNSKTDSPTVATSRHFGATRILDTAGGRITENLESLDGVTLETMNGEKSAIPENFQVIMQGAGFLWYDNGELFALVDSRELPGFNPATAFSTYGNYSELIFGKVTKGTNGNPKIKPFLDTEIVDAPAPVSVAIPPPVHPAPVVEKAAPGSFQFIRKALSVTYQSVMTKDIASIVHDALEGKMALSPVFLSGFAGLGKTYGVDVIASLLPHMKLVSLPPGFTAKAFKKALVDNCHDACIFFLDEMHDMESGCRNLLKAFTETNGKIKSFKIAIGAEEFTVTIDPRKHWFIGASNEPIKDSALVGASGRFRDCQFLPYAENDKSAILDAMAGQYLPGVNLPAATRKIIARNVRPFARSIKMILERLRTEGKAGADLATEDGIKGAIAAAGYYPGGWRGEHIAILKFLSASPAGRQVQEIAQGPMRGASTGQASAVLAELMQGDLIVTLGNGRKAATETAVKLLKSLERK